MENNRTTELQLEIISPDGKVFAGTAGEVSIPTAQGEIAVLPGHAPLFAKLAAGEIAVKRGGDVAFIAITGGFLEIQGNRVSILADYAVRSEEIEAQKAADARKKAETALKEKAGTRDFAMAEKDLMKLTLQLKISDKVKQRKRPAGR